MGELPCKEFWMLLLNRANKIMETVKVSEGGISRTVVDPKKIFCIALENHATSILISLCHPSGRVPHVKLILRSPKSSKMPVLYLKFLFWIISL
jgi:DNA repair protein RadC